MPTIQRNAGLSPVAEDSLKAARLTHDLVLGFLAVTLAFLLSGREDSQPYVDALKELDALNSFRSELTQMRKEFETQVDRLAASDVQAISKALEEELNWKIDSSKMRASRALPFHIFMPPLDKDVQGLCDWLAKDSHPDVEWVGSLDAAGDRTFFRKLLSGLSPAPAEHPIALPEWRLLVSGWSDDVEYPEFVTMGLEHGRTTKYQPSAFPSANMRIVSGNAFDWLNERGVLQKLRGTDGRWCPSLRYVWEEVHDRTVESATRFIRERRDEHENRLSFTGATIDARAASTFVPLVAASLFAYIWLHLRQVVSLGAIRTEVAWLPLFRSRLADVYSVASFIAIPWGVIVWLFLFTKEFTSINILAVTGAATTSILALVATWRVRSKVT